MILNMKPMAIAEVIEYVKDQEGKEKLIEYLKKFGKLQKDKAEKIRNAINSLNNPKIKTENIVKLIDFLPQDQDDVNKIFNEARLNEEEVSAIIKIIKN